MSRNIINPLLNYFMIVEFNAAIERYIFYELSV